MTTRDRPERGNRWRSQPETGGIVVAPRFIVLEPVSSGRQHREHAAPTELGRSNGVLIYREDAPTALPAHARVGGACLGTCYLGSTSRGGSDKQTDRNNPGRSCRRLFGSWEHRMEVFGEAGGGGCPAVEGLSLGRSTEPMPCALGTGESIDERGVLPDLARRPFRAFANLHANAPVADLGNRWNVAFISGNGQRDSQIGPGQDGNLEGSDPPGRSESLCRNPL